MKNLAKKHILKIKPYRPGKPIGELKRELGIGNVIKLASNENALKPSGRVISRIAGSLRDLNRYPDSGCFYLKRKLSKKFGLRPENFVIGNGSDEVIVFAIRAFVKPGEEVIIARPTFLIYDIASRVENVKIRYVPLKDFRYDLASIKKAVRKKTKLVFIANPDNPTGTYVTKSEVREFMAGLRKDVIAFFDEAYYEFGSGQGDYPETIRFIKGGNVIITRSFSKIYSLAGLRVGYGIAAKNLIEAMEKVREPFNVNSLAQEAALAALDDKGYTEKSIKIVKKGKEFLYSELDSMGITYVPSATNFILIKIGKKAERVYKALLKKGVIIRYMGAWGLNDFVRVTVGTMEENRRFAKTLKGILGGRKT